MLKPLFSRRSLIAGLFLSIVFLIFWQHVLLLVRILLVYPLWSFFSIDTSLSLIRDGLDTTFERYPVRQWSVQWPPASALHTNESLNSEDPDLLRLSDGSRARLPDEKYRGVSYSEPDAPDLVPPILHHILLGMPIESMPKSWEASRNSCLALHPESAQYTHFFWDDVAAEKFMGANYSFFLRDFLGYRHTIQRADALRYFVLHHYGGIFLDLDLECRRSLGPLRRFPVVNVNAFPVGVSNGFMMAAAGHPFLSQLIQNLKAYDRSWFGIPYLDIMFSTGPMFLSSEHMRFFPALERKRQLRVLDGAEHRLRGKVVTPLFRHLGASSWHQGDVHFVLKVKEGLGHPIVDVTIASTLLLALAIWSWSKMKKDRRGMHISWIWDGAQPAPSIHYLSLHPVARTERFTLWGFGLATRRRKCRGLRRTEYEALEIELDRLSVGSSLGSDRTSLDSDVVLERRMEEGRTFSCNPPPNAPYSHYKRVLEKTELDGDTISNTSNSSSDPAVVLLVDRSS